MSNEADAKGDALLWLLMQIYQNEVKSNPIKGARTVPDSNLDCENTCIDCNNDDTIEFTVSNADESVYTTLTLKHLKYLSYPHILI